MCENCQKKFQLRRRLVQGSNLHLPPTEQHHQETPLERQAKGQNKDLQVHLQVHLKNITDPDKQQKKTRSNGKKAQQQKQNEDSEEEQIETEQPTEDSEHEAGPNIFIDILKPWRKFIKRLRQSHPLNELWSKSCLEVLKKEVTLQPDTETRWSSTVSMLGKALTVKEAVVELRHRARDLKEQLVSLAFFLSLFHSYFFILSFSALLSHFQKCIPDFSAETWNFVEKLVEVFGLTAQSLANLEGQKYVTQSLVLLEILRLEANNNAVIEKCMSHFHFSFPFHWLI